MKNTLKLVLSVLALGALLFPAVTQAATNIGRADMGADPLATDTDFITDSGVLTITSTKLAVVKKAFLDDGTGTEIASGSSVVKGTIVKFVMYIDNSTNAQASDVRIVDQLDKTGFTYQTGSLKWNNNTTATAATVATIFTDTNGGLALTDAISNADTGSVDTTPPAYAQVTFGAHSTQTNAVLNIPAGKIASFMFRARVN